MTSTWRTWKKPVESIEEKSKKKEEASPPHFPGKGLLFNKEPLFFFDFLNGTRRRFSQRPTAMKRRASPFYSFKKNSSAVFLVQMI